MRSGPPRRAEPGERGDCEADHALRAWLGKPHLPVLGPPRRIQQPAVGPERHPKLCALRDLRGWYCSFDIYYTTAMTDNLLSRAIRRLGGDPVPAPAGLPGEISQGGCRSGLDREPVDGVRGLVHRDGSPRGHDEYMGGHGRHACRADGVSDLPRDNHPVRRSGEGVPHAGGRTRCVFRERGFPAGRAVRFVLDFDRLTDQLSRVMVDELGDTPEIVAFLQRDCGRVNASREDRKRRARRELDAGD